MDSVEGKRRNDICQPCQEANTCTSTEAVGLCRECKEYMCQTCFHHHLKAKYCRTHVLLDLSETELTNTSGEDVEKCEKHQNETVRFYCRKHGQIGCGDCMLFDGHSSCHPEYIKDVSMNFRNEEEFKHLTEKLETLESDNNSIVKNIQKRIESNNDMSTKLVDNVKTFRKSVNSYLDKAEADSLSFANKMRAQNDKVIQTLVDGCQAVESDIENYKQKINCEQFSDRVLFIQSVLLKRKLQLVEDAIRRTNALNKFNNFEFKPDQQLNDIVTASKSLGTFINVSQIESSISTGKSAKATDRASRNKANESNAGNNTNLAVVIDSESCQNEGGRKETSTIYRIFVKTITGKTTEYSVTPSETIYALKEKIKDKEGIPVEKCVLSISHTGKQLADAFVISDYYIRTGSVLLLS